MKANLQLYNKIWKFTFFQEYLSVDRIFFFYLIAGVCQPTGVVDTGAGCYTEGTGFESGVRHGCKTVQHWKRGNGDCQIGAPIIKMVTNSGLSSRTKSVT